MDTLRTRAHLLSKLKLIPSSGPKSKFSNNHRKSCYWNKIGKISAVNLTRLFQFFFISPGSKNYSELVLFMRIACENAWIQSYRASNLDACMHLVCEENQAYFIYASFDLKFKRRI